MDVIALITIAASVAGIVGLLYLLLIGQRSIPEWWQERKRRIKEEKSSVAPRERRYSPSYSEYVRTLRSFWEFSENSYVDLVCSEIPKEERHYFADPRDRNYLRYAKFADLDTLIFVRSSLAHLFPRLFIRDFSPSEYFDTRTQGLIVIGGPPWNSKFREFQAQLPFRFVPKPLGQDDPLCIHAIEDARFLPTWGQSGQLIKDISIFVRIRIERDVPVFLIAGCLTFGVLGSAMGFLDRQVAVPNIELVRSHVDEDDFILVFETHRVAGFVVPTSLPSAKPLVILRRSAQTAGFRVECRNTGEYENGPGREDDVERFGKSPLER